MEFPEVDKPTLLLPDGDVIEGKCVAGVMVQEGSQEEGAVEEFTKGKIKKLEIPFAVKCLANILDFLQSDYCDFIEGEVEEHIKEEDTNE